MSVLIDMEMPRDCEECPLNDEYAECALLGKFVTNVGRLPDCPLREVDYGRLVLFLYEMGKAWDAIQHLTELLKEDEKEQAQIVHCKDCYFFDVVNQPYCENWCTVMSGTVDEDGYCYRGKKKTND